jgi:hypothetical protein
MPLLYHHDNGMATAWQRHGNGMATAWDFWLKPTHALPLPLQQRGLRRAQALFCHGSTSRGVRLCLSPLFLWKMG